LDASLSYIREALENLTLQDLESPRTTPDKREVDSWLVSAHILAHTANHVGHMQLTRQFLTTEADFLPMMFTV